MEREDTDDRRPTPVRMAMEGKEAETPEEELRHRSFMDAGGAQEWIARVSGTCTSGVLPLRVIPIMEVAFSKVQEPDRPLRKAVARGTALEELEDHQLQALLETSRPFGDPGEGSRRRRGGRET